MGQPNLPVGDAPLRVFCAFDQFLVVLFCTAGRPVFRLRIIALPRLPGCPVTYMGVGSPLRRRDRSGFAPDSLLLFAGASACTRFNCRQLEYHIRPGSSSYSRNRSTMGAAVRNHEAKRSGVVRSSSVSCAGVTQRSSSISSESGVKGPQCRPRRTWSYSYS